MADSIAQPTPTSKDMLESSLELAAGIAELDNLIERHVEEFNRLKGQRDALLAALKDITPDVPPADAMCHKAICSQDKCAHCRRIIAARKAIAKAEGR